MIKFTNELNAKEFAPIGEQYKNAVQCATCHRGSTKPIEDTRLFMESKRKKTKNNEKLITIIFFINLIISCKGDDVMLWPAIHYQL